MQPTEVLKLLYVITTCNCSRRNFIR